MIRLLSLHLIFVFSGIHCNNDNTDIEETDGKYNSAIKEPISTPEDFLTLDNGKDLLPKLVRLLIDAEYREGRNRALKTVTPSKDLLRPRILDDDILDLVPVLPDIPVSKIHMHHIFPPALIRPLQRAIIRKMIHFVQNDPIKKMKKRVIKKMRIGTVAVGLGLGVRELNELKSHPLTAQYKVTGLVDLSGQKTKDNYGEHGEFGDGNHQERYKRSATFPVEDTYDPDYKTVKDYKLIPSKHYWPFHEPKEEIYEKWNKFPKPVHIDPFQHKVKHLHRSFHELQPDILHLVQDVHGLVGTKTKIISSGPDLEHPIVLAGQLVKLADSFIPSIRIRIPFLEYLKKSFFEKSKPKVVYVKQPPKVKYVGLPYKEEDESYPMPEPEPIQVNIPITVPEPVIVAEPVSEYDQRRQITAQNSPEKGNGNYELITDLKSPDELTVNRPLGGHNYDSAPPNQHRYSQMFDHAAQVYRDKKKAKA